MRNVISISKREILSFFVSPVAYFVITGFLLLGGYFFFNLLGMYEIILQRIAQMPMQMAMDMPNLNQWVVEPFFKTLVVVLVFLVPLLTMRIIAEEKRSGTFELLITSPVKVSEIVLGKFLGVSFVIIVMMLLVFIFPFLLFIYGDPGPEIAPILSGILGLTLCALAFVSLGMAVSSFTESQVVAGICSMVALLLIYVIHSPAEAASGFTADLLMYLSPMIQMQDMLRGVISIKAIVYFLSFISLGLFLSGRALEMQRWR